jgi:RNA polymerase sigma-70 factor (family 1)
MQQISEPGFTKIFDEYYAPLVLYAFKITDDQLAAEVIIEDAFINLWNKRRSFNEIKSLKAYLYTIARNGCLSWVRKNKRETERNKSLTFTQEFDKTALESMIYAETMKRVYDALDKLPKRIRQVFIMHYIEGKKISEIAQELGISIGTVKTHKQRGIDILQRLLHGMPLILIIEALKK